ncbi:MAG: hypothetical protein ACFFFT_06510 [Candidatus Thorarchaeota archaeon]
MVIPSISSITIANTTNDYLPNNFNDIHHLEYLLQFSPPKEGYLTAKYALDLEKYNESGESYIKISVHYEDLSLTLFNDNYNYKIALSSREIIEVSNSDYNEYMLGTHTELFLNTSEFENSTVIRIDEPLTFSNYLKDYQDPESLRSDITFNYVGVKKYNSSLLYNFTTHHYKIRHVLWVQGEL